MTEVSPYGHIQRGPGDETTYHLMMKDKAIKLLGLMGFAKDQIFTEYEVTDGKAKGAIVDVVGIKDGNKIAIECGQTDPVRLVRLETSFTEVFWLPYYGKRSDWFNERADQIRLKETKDELELQVERKFARREREIQHNETELHKTWVDIRDECDAISKAVSHLRFKALREIPK